MASNNAEFIYYNAIVKSCQLSTLPIKGEDKDCISIEAELYEVKKGGGAEPCVAQTVFINELSPQTPEQTKKLLEKLEHAGWCGTFQGPPDLGLEGNQIEVQCVKKIGDNGNKVTYYNLAKGGGGNFAKPVENAKKAQARWGMLTGANKPAPAKNSASTSGSADSGSKSKTAPPDSEGTSATSTVPEATVPDNDDDDIPF